VKRTLTYKLALLTRLIIILIISLVSTTSYSQIKQKKLKKDPFPSYFGLQVKPIIPVQMFGTGPETLEDGTFTATVTPLWGYSFGGTVRAGITKRLAIETGLNIVKRNYRTDYAVPDSGLTSTTTVGIISYDVPLNLLIYVQFSKQWFMNVSYGVSGNFYPSNVRADDNSYPDMFMTEGLRKSWIRIAMNANVGIEYRTEKSGFFYIGASFQYPFGPIFDIAAVYKHKSINRPIFGEMNGTYITVDLKYFFPTIDRKGKQFKPGPVDM